MELRFPEAQGDEPGALDVTFSAMAWATLQLFVECVTELNASSPMQKGWRIHIELRGERGRGLQSAVTVPSDEDVKLLLHCARPLILEKEPTSTARVIGLLRPRLVHPRVQRFLDQQHQLFSGRDGQAQLRVSVCTVAGTSGQLADERVINSDKVFQDWVNAHEYHRDAGRREHLETLYAALPPTVVRAFCLSLLADKIDASRRLAHLIRGLGSPGEFWLRGIPQPPFSEGGIP